MKRISVCLLVSTLSSFVFAGIYNPPTIDESWSTTKYDHASGVTASNLAASANSIANAALPKDGASPMIGDLNMGGNSITNVGTNTIWLGQVGIGSAGTNLLLKVGPSNSVVVTASNIEQISPTPSVPIRTVDPLTMTLVNGRVGVADWIPRNLVDVYVQMLVHQGSASKGMIDGPGYLFNDQNGILTEWGFSTNQTWRNVGYDNYSQGSSSVLAMAVTNVVGSGSKGYGSSTYGTFNSVSNYTFFVWIRKNGDFPGQYSAIGWATVGGDFAIPIMLSTTYLGGDNCAVHPQHPGVGNGGGAFALINDVWTSVVTTYSNTYWRIYTNGVLVNTSTFDWGGETGTGLRLDRYSWAQGSGQYDISQFGLVRRCFSESQVQGVFGSGILPVSEWPAELQPASGGTLENIYENAIFDTSFKFESVYNAPNSPEFYVYDSSVSNVFTVVAGAGSVTNQMSLVCTNKLLDFIPTSTWLTILASGSGVTTNDVKGYVSPDYGTNWYEAALTPYASIDLSNTLFQGTATFASNVDQTNMVLKAEVSSNRVTRILGIWGPSN